MTRYLTLISTAILIIVSSSSCAVIGGIFKAGVWTGVVLVAAILGAIIYFISAATKRK